MGEHYKLTQRVRHTAPETWPFCVICFSQKSNLKSENVSQSFSNFRKNGQEMDKFHDLLWISGQSTKFQEFQDSGQAWLMQVSGVQSKIQWGYNKCSACPVQLLEITMSVDWQSRSNWWFAWKMAEKNSICEQCSR